jgi:signal transduction histidine kinase
VRALRLLLWPAGVAIGIGAESASFGWSQPDEWLPDLATGWTLIACGLIAWSRRSDSRSGPIMAATGFAWFAANFASDLALYLHRGPLIHLVLSYPRGRLGGRVDRFAVAIAYGAAVIPAVWRSEAATFVLAGLVVTAAGHGYVRAVGREQQTRLAALQATAFVAAVLAGTAAARLAFPTQGVTEATLLVYEAGLCALAIGLLAGLVREPWERTQVTDLVVDLGEARSGTLRDALARALGDPTLEVGYWLGDGYVDADGRPLALPGSGSQRRVTPVERDGEAIAVLVHDPAVLDDPGLSDALATAARLSASNARLQADVREQLVELRASRRRLVHAGDEERRRLERRLRETVQRRLTQLAQALEAAHSDSARAELVRGAEEQLAHALDELRDLAAGLDPGGMGQGTLADALESLVARSPVPVELSVPNMELPEEAATAAYFVCSEALANVLKYASASRVAVSVSAQADRVAVEVADDGVGGAAIGAGTGLRGLADRVEALGGTLRLASPPGQGTRLAVELPLTDQGALSPAHGTVRTGGPTRRQGSEPQTN